MKAISLLILCLSLLSCNIDTRESDINKLSSNENTGTDTLNFLSACNSLQRWQGGIQGVQVSDSTYGYPMAECHTNKSYDLIWVPKGDILKASEYDYFDARKSNFKEFDCYAFVIPKMQPQSQAGDCECGEEYDYVFPSMVTVYRMERNHWIRITSQSVTSFEQLGRLKLNTIFRKY